MTEWLVRHAYSFFMYVVIRLQTGAKRSPFLLTNEFEYYVVLRNRQRTFNRSCLTYRYCLPIVHNRASFFV